jgi:threonine/homoserine/homoserine lactone efflux protein
VIGLLVFTICALAGCAFLIYFLVALCREARRTQHRVPAFRFQREHGKVVVMKSAPNLETENTVHAKLR